MVKTFFPEISEHLDASSPHPQGTSYKVSVGVEDWGGQHVPVVKVQMSYNGTVAGRRSPSYPLGTDDYLRVTKCVARLTNEYLNTYKDMYASLAKDNQDE